MGANYVSRQFDKCSFADLENRVDTACQQAGYESGHSYSGDWGEKISYGVEESDEFFSSYDEADDYLSRHTEKWGPLIAIKFLKTTPKSTRFDKSIDDAKGKLKELKMKTGDAYCPPNFKTRPLMEGILARVKASKSKYKSCECCGSKISVAHISRHFCPICHDQDFLLTATDKKQFERLRAKIAKLERQIKDLESKRQSLSQDAVRDGSDWFWLVGGWCSS